MKRLLGPVILLLLAAPLIAQQPFAFGGFPIVSAYNVQSASYIYPLYKPRVQVGNAYIKTTGSTTTIDAATTGVTGLPFANSTVGDQLEINTGGAGPTNWQYRVIVTINSNIQVVIDQAIDLSANGTAGFGPFWYRPFTAGSAAQSGFFDVSDFTERTISFGWETINATSDNVRIECIDSVTGAPYTQPVQVYPPVTGSGACQTATFTVGGIASRCKVPILETEQRCRIGVKANTPTSTQNFWATFIGRGTRAPQ